MRHSTARLVLGLVLITPTAAAQVDEVPVDIERMRTHTTALYAAALAACVDAEVEAYGRFGFLTDSTAITVERVGNLPRELPGRIGAHPVRLLTGLEVQRLAREEGEVSVRRALPFMVDGPSLVVSFSDYVVSTYRRFLRRRLYAYELYGGCHASFRTRGEGFDLVGVSLWGV